MRPVYAARVIALMKFAMVTMMPRTEGLPGIEDCDLDGFLERMRRDSDALYWLGMIVGAWVYMLTPIVTVYLPLPAIMLPEKLLAKHSERIIASRIYLLRQAVFLVRLSAGMCWGADPAVRAKFALGPYASDPGTFRAS
ncbi:MAG: hypothetical protein ACXVEE_37625 [Polyangiales bacterium]